MLRAAGADLPDEEVAALARRTEGWAAGLYLAALSRTRSRPAAGSPRHRRRGPARRRLSAVRVALAALRARPRLPDPHVGARSPVGAAVRRGARGDGFRGGSRAPQAEQPVPRPPRRPGRVVPLPPAVPGPAPGEAGAAAVATRPGRCCAEPGPGSRPTASSRPPCTTPRTPTTSTRRPDRYRPRPADVRVGSIGDGHGLVRLAGRQDAVERHPAIAAQAAYICALTGRPAAADRWGDLAERWSGQRSGDDGDAHLPDVVDDPSGDHVPPRRGADVPRRRGRRPAHPGSREPLRTRSTRLGCSSAGSRTCSSGTSTRRRSGSPTRPSCIEQTASGPADHRGARLPRADPAWVGGDWERRGGSRRAGPVSGTPRSHRIAPHQRSRLRCGRPRGAAPRRTQRTPGPTWPRRNASGRCCRTRSPGTRSAACSRWPRSRSASVTPAARDSSSGTRRPCCGVGRIWECWARGRMTLRAAGRSPAGSRPRHRDAHLRRAAHPPAAGHPPDRGGHRRSPLPLPAHGEGPGVVDVPEARRALPRRRGRPGTGTRPARPVTPAARHTSAAPDPVGCNSATSPDDPVRTVTHDDGIGAQR